MKFQSPIQSTEVHRIFKKYIEDIPLFFVSSHDYKKQGLSQNLAEETSCRQKIYILSTGKGS